MPPPLGFWMSSHNMNNGEGFKDLDLLKCGLELFPRYLWCHSPPAPDLWDSEKA